MVTSPAAYFCGMSEQLRKQVGAAVKAARKAKGLTQDELAKGIGLSQSNIALLEKGGYNISLDQLEKIAVALGQNVQVLLNKE